MKSSRVINLLFLFLLFAPFARAQKADFSLQPFLGLQSPLSNIVTDGFTKGTTVNNRIWPIITYGIDARYEFKNGHFFIVSLLNGQAGYSAGIRSNINCGNGYMGIHSDQFLSSSYNEKRVLFSGQWPLKPVLRSSYITMSFRAGLGVDIRSNEIDGGQFISYGINQCGESFTINDEIYNHRYMSLILPLQVNVEVNKRLTFSFFYHWGISRHYDIDLTYITDTYSEISRLKNKGTSYGITIGYPIKICQVKQKRG
jgi:hypothetical protein